MFRWPARPSRERADPPADPRGERFAAAVTAVVLLAVLATSSEALFAAQTVVSALGAFVGLRYAPYQALYRAVFVGSTGPRPAAPYRFAQRLGFTVALLGTLGYLTGLAGLGAAAASVLLVFAVANAAFGFCAGAELYQFLNRSTRPSHP
jgi:hypothetical protein